MTRDLSGVGIWAVLLGLALTSSVLAAVLGKLLDRGSAHLDRLREGYAEAAKALVAWDNFPYRIERRVDDDPETRRSLSELGSDIGERLAYYSGWVSADSRVMGEFYMTLVARLRTDVAHHARSAWNQPPRRSAPEMNIRNVSFSPDDRASGWAYVQVFSAGFRYRFGWRRYLIPAPLLRRLLAKEQLAAVTLAAAGRSNDSAESEGRSRRRQTPRPAVETGELAEVSLAGPDESAEFTGRREHPAVGNTPSARTVDL